MKGKGCLNDKMIDKLLYILSKTISVLLHPLLLPTYGFALIAAGDLFNIDNNRAWLYYLIATAGTFIFTCLIPLSMILILRHQQRVSSIELNSQKERTVPYLYSFVSFAIWCYFVKSILHIDSAVFFICCAATTAIGIVALINLWWKISAHATGIGCFIGGVMIIAAEQWQLGNLFICLLFAMALALCYARIYLQSHTPAQVSAGLLLGLLLSSLTLLLY